MKGVPDGDRKDFHSSLDIFQSLILKFHCPRLRVILGVIVWNPFKAHKQSEESEDPWCCVGIKLSDSRQTYRLRHNFKINRNHFQKNIQQRFFYFLMH